MNFMASANCMKAATAAADGKLTADEVLQAFDRIDQYARKLEADGQFTGRAERIRKFAEGEAERAKIAAAMAKRHAALNILVRRRLDDQVNGMLASGVKPKGVMLALLEGTLRGVKNGRKSVAATVNAYEARYKGGLLAAIQRERPHLVAILGDKKLDTDVTREMMELRKGGKPGVTGNEDAKWMARTFAEFAELSRTELNRLGASIGKLDGWAGAQTHDDLKMIKAGKDAWVGFVVTRLDTDRTFPDGLTGEEAAKVLGDIYDTLISGISNTPSPAEMGRRVNPANLGKSLGKSRVLHFRDADAALSYREKFGYGNATSGMFAHLSRAAKMAGAMEVLGPNPEIMFTGVAEGLKRRLKSDPKVTDAAKNKLDKWLNTEGGALRDALNISTGLLSRPVDSTFAAIGQAIRAQQSVSKLGGALWSSLGDPTTAAIASQFRGSGFLKGVATQWAGIMRGRPRGEQAEIAYLIGEGFDGLIGHVASPFAGTDTPAGLIGRMQERFFRYSGLTWWTDVNRAVAGRVLAAELGMRLGTRWEALKPQYRHVLELHGFDAASWGVMKKATLRHANGNTYMTPDRIRALSDEDLEPLARERLASADKLTGQAKDDFVAGVVGDTRRQLELQLLRFYSDETSNAIIESDARTQRTMTMGTRSGTWLGEVVRLVAQFKAYPIAFTRRVVGREIFGLRSMSGAETLATHLGHVGTLIMGMGIAGYMSLTANDIRKGYWPPRDPTDWRTWLAALQQGGGLGIYSDFLFSQSNRYGGDATSTAVGPAFGTFFDLLKVWLDARDAALSGGENTFAGGKALSDAIANVPFANLWWVKPALDYLVLNAAREAASPGYLKRQTRDRQRQYGQSRWSPVPQTAVQ